jgi:hypothetical protein
VTARMPRSIYRRMEALETQLAPAAQQVIHKIQFISPVDHSVVSELEVGSHRLGPLPRKAKLGRGDRR